MKELQPLSHFLKMAYKDLTDEQLAEKGFIREAPTPEATKEYWSKVRATNNAIEYTDEQRKKIIVHSLNLQVQSRGKAKFEYNEVNRDILSRCYEILKKNSKKGIFIHGGTGTGKTTILRACMGVSFGAFSVDEWHEKKPLITTCIDLVNHFDINQSYQFYLERETYFDDLGSEPKPKFSRKDDDPIMGKIIELRYARNLRTHFTSNHSPEEIGEIYGQRVFSRLFDMCHVIEFTGTDMRLQ